MEKLTAVTGLIKSYLEKMPKLRDDDRRLIANVWHNNLKYNKMDPNEMTAMEFIRLYSKGNFISPSTITRNRRKLQETYPSLRGKLYTHRQRKASKVKEEVNELTEKLSSPAGG